MSTNTLHDTTVTSIAGKATMTGSASAILFGLTSHELAALAGIAVAIIGLLVNIWYKHQHLKLARERAKKNCDIPTQSGDSSL